jgi:hypothetical protein
MEGNRSRRRGKEEGGLTREATMSATETEKEGVRTLVGSAAGSTRDAKQGEGRVGRAVGLARLGPRQESGERRARESKWAAGKSWATGPKTRKRGKFLFLFPFQLIESIFK